MRPRWESRKRQSRFKLSVTQSASMSACSFQAGKALSRFFPSPMNSCMRCLDVRNPGIVSLLPGGLNWRPCFPDMYPAWHAKGQGIRLCEDGYNKTAPIMGQQDQNTISLDLMNRMKLYGMA